MKIGGKRRKREPPGSNFLFVFFDLECMQSKPTNIPGENLHQPNLCVSRQCCNVCIDNYEGIMDDFCLNCGKRENVFYGLNCLSEFITHLQSTEVDFKDVTCIAHNGGRYDFLCLVKVIVVDRKWKPDIISNVAKIITFKYGNLQFVDSLNFFSTALSKLVKMMSIEGGIGKGYFPHLFNRPEFQDYEGNMPDLKYFSPDGMSPKERAALIEWHANKVAESYIFNF